MARSRLGIFEEVLNNSRDISAIYHNDLEVQRALSDGPGEFVDLLAAFREQMQAAGGIKRLSETPRSTITDIECSHIDGLIAAVDGSDAISCTERMAKTIYAAGVISVTAKTLHQPRIVISESYRKIPTITKEDDFFAFLDQLDRWVDDDQSWIRTFREYCERREAMRLIDETNCLLILIDGPLYTQNLLTQRTAQNEILQEMQNNRDRLIGFIKDLQTSKVMHLAGMALESDEYWTVDNWRDMLARRFRNDTQKLEWINRQPDWVRTIYRKHSKAFAFECAPCLVELGIALIVSPICCAAVINHEIPFLLHCADRTIQARLAARAKSENLIFATDYYANLADERRFR